MIVAPRLSLDFSSFATRGFESPLVHQILKDLLRIRKKHVVLVLPSNELLDLRSHQFLRPDFGEGGPLSSGHYLHRADTHEQPFRRNFPIGRLQGALVTTPAGASDRPHSRARLDLFRSCGVPTDDNPETRARMYPRKDPLCRN